MLLTALFAATSLLSSLSHAASSPDIRSVQISYQPVQPQSKPKSLPLATIEYNITSLTGTITTYTPPDASSLKTSPDDTSHPLFHISLPPSLSRSTTVASLSAFHPEYATTLTLHLNADNTVFAVSLSADHLEHPQPNAKSQAPTVVLLRSAPGPTPQLIAKKPIVIDEEGRQVPEVEVVEKSLLQRYWWVFGLVALFALSGGGGDGK